MNNVQGDIIHRGTLFTATIAVLRSFVYAHTVDTRHSSLRPRGPGMTLTYTLPIGDSDVEADSPLTVDKMS